MIGVAGALRDWLFTGAEVIETTPETRPQFTRDMKSRRLTCGGHLTLATLVLCLAGVSYWAARMEANRRVDMMEYCQRDAIKREKPEKFPIAETSMIIDSAVPIATKLQQQRLIQQSRELLRLYTYHCRSLQVFSSNYQALLTVANASAVVSATTLTILGIHGLKGEIRWPLSVLASSAFALGLSMTSIQTFRLSSNLSASRNLLGQTNALTRSFATSIANQAYTDSKQTLNLANRKDLGSFISAMDHQIMMIDIASFDVEEGFAAEEAKVFLKRSAKPEGQHSPEPN